MGLAHVPGITQAGAVQTSQRSSGRAAQAGCGRRPCDGRSGVFMKCLMVAAARSQLLCARRAEH